MLRQGSGRSPITLSPSAVTGVEGSRRGPQPEPKEKTGKADAATLHPRFAKGDPDTVGNVLYSSSPSYTRPPLGLAKAHSRPERPVSEGLGEDEGPGRGAEWSVSMGIRVHVSRSPAGLILRCPPLEIADAVRGAQHSDVMSIGSLDKPPSGEQDSPTGPWR